VECRKPGQGVPSVAAERSRWAHSQLTWLPFVCIAAAALAVEIPFFFRGTPSGHDIEFHLYSWLEVLSQWRQGILYPRWAYLAHFGYGEPRFVFYPPASWMLGAALSAIFPWTLAAGIYIWGAITAAGTSMFFLAGQWMERQDATFVAVLYAVNPYHLLIVYWRSALAELLASALAPLLLLVLLRNGANRKHRILTWAVLLAGGWLIDAPAAVMLHYSFAFLLLVIAWQRRSYRLMAEGAMAVVLGAMLAAFYLLPAIYEQRWVDIAESISEGSRPMDNFLFIHTKDADHDRFNRMISWVAVSEIGVTLAAGWAARQGRKSNRDLWQLLMMWALASTILMWPFSNFLWEMLPKIRYMQFPWRWLLCLGVPLALFVTMALRSWAARVALYLAMLAVVAFVGLHYRRPWWDNRSELRAMRDNMLAGKGYEGADEYTPLGGDASEVDKDARRVTVAGPAHAAIHVFEWGAERKIFTAQMSASDELALKLFNYPAWQVEVNGHIVSAETREENGQMLVPVQEGANQVEIIFLRTWDRTAGAWISALGAFVAFYFFKKLGRTSQH
jgi:hypothetical protein